MNGHSPQGFLLYIIEKPKMAKQEKIMIAVNVGLLNLVRIFARR